MRHVRITIEIGARTNLDDDTLERRLESLVDPAELAAQALEENEQTEFDSTTFRFFEPGSAFEPSNWRAEALSLLPGVREQRVDDSELKQAPNLEAILAWVDAKRPDISEHIRWMASGSWKNETSCQALMLLLTVGFAAGRQYQHEHREISPEVYHRF